MWRSSKEALTLHDSPLQSYSIWRGEIWSTLWHSAVLQEVTRHQNMSGTRRTFMMMSWFPSGLIHLQVQTIQSVAACSSSIALKKSMTGNLVFPILWSFIYIICSSSVYRQIYIIDHYWWCAGVISSLTFHCIYSGNYHCVATNKFGSIVSESVQLSFGFIGEFNLKRSNEKALEHWGKAIYCDPPQYFPDIQYYWVKNKYNRIIDQFSLEELILKLVFSLRLDRWEMFSRISLKKIRGLSYLSTAICTSHHWRTLIADGTRVTYRAPCQATVATDLSSRSKCNSTRITSSWNSPTISRKAFRTRRVSARKCASSALLSVTRCQSIIGPARAPHYPRAPSSPTTTASWFFRKWKSRTSANTSAALPTTRYFDCHFLTWVWIWRTDWTDWTTVLIFFYLTLVDFDWRHSDRQCTSCTSVYHSTRWHAHGSRRPARVDLWGIRYTRRELSVASKRSGS